MNRNQLVKETNPTLILPNIGQVSPIREIEPFYLYELKEEKDTICILCEGSHGNNTLCQMSMEDSRHGIY
jgi:hypothetical protein